MKKLQVILGVSVMVVMGGIAMFGNQQFKISSQSGLLAESPPSLPKNQRNPPGYGGNGDTGSGTHPHPPMYTPKLPRG